MERELRQDGGRTDEQAVERRVSEIAATESLVEAVAGIGAIVLGVLGLLDIQAVNLAAIGLIVLGVALLFEGVAVLARYNQLAHSRAGARVTVDQEISGGIMLEMIGGISVIVLGVLALLSLNEMTLMAIGVIAFGATMLLSAGTSSRLEANEAMRYRRQDVDDMMARDAAMSGTVIRLLTGVGGVVLGILALVGVNDELNLILAAVTAFGAALLLTGSVLSSRVLSLMQS